MFYLKTKKGNYIEINGENTFCKCPECGKWFQMDMADAVCDGKLDLYGTSWFCDKCSDHHAISQ